MNKQIFGIATLGVVCFSALYWAFHDSSQIDARESAAANRAPATVGSASLISSEQRGDFPLVKTENGEVASLGSIATYRAEASRLKACYSGGCAYPETDPRSYEFALGQDLRAALLGAAKLASEQGLMNEDLAALAREFLDNQDGYVQEGALALLGTQAPSKDNLQAILQYVIGGYDAQLLPGALRELARYQQQSEAEQIDSAFAQALLSGAPFVAAYLSRNLQSFVRDSNFRFYRDLADKLPTGSIYRANLEEILKRYQIGA